MTSAALRRAAPDAVLGGVLSVCRRLRRRGRGSSTQGLGRPHQQRRRHLDVRDRSPRRPGCDERLVRLCHVLCCCCAGHRKASGPLSTTTGGTTWTYSPNRDASSVLRRTRCGASRRGPATLASYNQYPPGPLRRAACSPRPTAACAGTASRSRASSCGSCRHRVHRRRRRACSSASAVGPGRPGAAPEGGDGVDHRDLDRQLRRRRQPSRAPRRCAASPSAPARRRRGGRGRPHHVLGRRALERREQALPPFSSLGRLACPAAPWCYATGRRGARRATVEERRRELERRRPRLGVPAAPRDDRLPLRARLPDRGHLHRGRTSSQPLRTTEPRRDVGYVCSLGGALATSSIACPTARLCAS